MADGQRVYPVNQFVQHHSTGSDFTDVDHDTIAKWYSDVGRTRGYAGVAHSGHFFTPSKGARYETFAQAHLAGHLHNNRYCVFPIMDDIWNNVAWGAGNWEINQRAINIEHCGNYLNRAFLPGQSEVTADFWRPQDSKLGGKSYVNPHNAFSATACPARIKDAIPTIIQYINNPPTTPPPTDPCKAVKDELAKTRKLLATCTTNTDTLNAAITALKAENDKLKATNEDLNESYNDVLKENESLKQELADCENKPPASNPCEVVKGMTVWELIKCKWG